MAQRRARARLWERLESLPAGYREVLVMFYREERSAPRVAEHLGISLAAAQQRLSRGRKMLGAQVDPDEARVLSEGPSPRFAQGVVLGLPVLEPVGAAPPPSGGTVSVLGTVLKALAMKKMLALVAGVVVLFAITHYLQPNPPQVHPESADPESPARSESLGGRASAPVAVEASHRLCGSVRDADDERPLAAVVTITRPRGEVGLTATRTDAQGRWCIDALGRGAYFVAASSPRHLPAHAELRVDHADATLDLALSRGGRLLSGTVNDMGGGPIVGALVTARGIRTAGTMTDDEGNFRLSLPDGAYTVRAAEPDYEPAETHATLAGRDVEVELSLVPGATLAGVVLDRNTRQPVPGMTVDWDYSARRGAARSGGSADPHERVVSDASGRFDLRQLSPGQYELFAAGDHRASRAPSVVALEIAEQRTDVVVFVDPAADARGYVRFGDGGPAADAELRVVHAENGHRVHARTDDSGAFTIQGLLPGRYSVMVTGQGVATSMYGTQLEVPPQGDPEATEISVARTTTVAGRLDPPVQGRINISPASDGMDRFVAWTKTMHVRTESDADGRFALSEVPPGTWLLVATAADGSKAREKLDVPEEGLDDLVLSLERRAMVRGRIVDTGEVPIAGAQVTVVARARGAEGEENVGWATADQNGSFVVTGLAPGQYVLRGRAATRAELVAVGGGVDLALLTVEGTEEQALEIVAVAPRARVEGRVVDAAGAPQPDAWVTLADDGDSTREPVLTDDDGTFAFDGVPEAVVSVEATHGDARAIAQIDSSSATTVELTLESLATVRGLVTHDGEPVEQFEVGDRRFVTADGRFELTRLVGDEYELKVVADVGSTKRMVALRPGETTEVQLELGGWGAVRGRAVDLEGQPVAGIAVAVMSEGGDRDGGARTLERLGGGGLTTDADGRFEVEGLGPGRGSIMVGTEDELLTGGRIATRYFSIAPGGVTDLGDVVLIELKISDPAKAGTFEVEVGEPPEKGRLAVPEDERTLRVRTVEPDGPAAKAGLEPGQRIVAVAGHDVAKIGATTAALLLTPGVHEAGHRLEISVETDDGSRQLELVAAAWDGRRHKD